MATVIQHKVITAREFMEMDLDAGTFELVRGEVVQSSPPMPRHGRICVRVLVALELYGSRTRYGYALSNDSAMQTEWGPDTVRGVEVMFYSEARWPQSDVGWRIPPVPPDVAVEVLSPSNRPGEIGRKVAEYLKAGVLLVWIVDPEARSVSIYRRGAESAVVLVDGEMVGELPELPGFECGVSEFLV